MPEIFNIYFSFSEICFAITTILNRRFTAKDSEFCVLNTPRNLRYPNSLSILRLVVENSDVTSLHLTSSNLKPRSLPLILLFWPWIEFGRHQNCEYLTPFSIFQFPMMHSVCPPNYCCEILLRICRPPRSISQQ